MGAVEDVVDALDGLVHLLGVGEIGGKDLRPHARDARSMAEVAHDAAHFDSLFEQDLGEPAADEAGRAGDEHLAAGGDRGAGARKHR